MKSSKENLTITLSGPRGCGKTTMKLLLAKLFSDLGMKIEFFSENQLPDFKGAVELAQRSDWTGRKISIFENIEELDESVTVKMLQSRIDFLEKCLGDECGLPE